MKKIMLVDDDADLLVLLRDVLKGQGYEVTTMQEASNVLAVVDIIKPDLLILDINIHQVDGRDICNQIKQNHAYDYMRVILFSALVQEKQAMAGCQADAYVEKPISTPSFLRKIESLMAA